MRFIELHSYFSMMSHLLKSLPEKCAASHVQVAVNQNPFIRKLFLVHFLMLLSDAYGVEMQSLPEAAAPPTHGAGLKWENQWALKTTGHEQAAGPHLVEIRRFPIQSRLPGPDRTALCTSAVASS